MREIKFRAYVKLTKEIFEVGKIDIQHGKIYKRNHPSSYYYIDDVELMEYTGFKDKNGVEIYEGNIIRTFCDKGYGKRAKKVEIISQVIYCVDNGKTIGGSDTNYFSGFDTKQLNKQDWTNCDWSMFFECEVIGNIYDNPELIGG